MDSSHAQPNTTPCCTFDMSVQFNNLVQLEPGRCLHALPSRLECNLQIACLVFIFGTRLL